MTKSILVTCDFMPHVLEYMEPAVDEARRRGYKVVGAYFGKPSASRMSAMGIRDLHHFGAVWDKNKKPPVLRIPQADDIFRKVRPKAVFVDMSGVGHAGGAWIEEAHRRGIISIEFGGCRSRVYRFGERTKSITDQYIAQLRKEGYGKHSDGLLVGTGAWQWVGLNVGDRLREPLNKAGFKKSLGLGPNQKYVLFMGNWGVGHGYGNMTSADLSEWNEMAQDSGIVLVYSPHPTFYYADIPPHVIPKNVVLTSSFPARLWGRKAIPVNTFDLVRTSEFVIYQYRNGADGLCMAAKKPMWLRRRSSGRGDPAKFSRVPWDRVSKDVIWKHHGWPYAERMKREMDEDLRSSVPYRTAKELELLFAGKLKFPGSEKERVKWRAEWRLRLDGKTAERTVDLIE